MLIIPCDSYAKSDGKPAEIDRNHETVEFTHSATPDQPDDAGDEYGDDKGACLSYKALAFSNIFVVGWHYGGDARRRTRHG